MDIKNVGAATPVNTLDTMPKPLTAHELVEPPIANTTPPDLFKAASYKTARKTRQQG
jgi:hypothetical protein